MQTNSQNLRDILARLDADLINAGNRLVEADAELNTRVRQHIASGAKGPAPATTEAITAARDEIARITTTRDEARRMMEEALSAEKEERESAARADLRDLTGKMEGAARQVDETAALLARQLRQLSALAKDAQVLMRHRLNREPPLSHPASEAAARIASTISTATSWNPQDQQPHAEEHTAKFIRGALWTAGA